MIGHDPHGRRGGQTGPAACDDLQRADHVRLDRLMARARETVDDGGIAHQVALRAVARLVFTHAFAEEAVLSRRRAGSFPRAIR